ncbi:MAG: response regulator [Acidobacteriota bacterium]|nr:response regulator [Acidobacteriota bacterium]
MAAHIPLTLARYLRSLWLSTTLISYLKIDATGDLIDFGGHWRHFGLAELTLGLPITEQVSFLEGLLPVTHTQILRFLAIEQGHYAHVHIIPTTAITWVLLLDATVDYERQQKMQQQVNNLSLLTYRQSRLLQELETTRKILAQDKQRLEQASLNQQRLLTQLSQTLHTSLTSWMNDTQVCDVIKHLKNQQTDPFVLMQTKVNQVLQLVDNILEQTKTELTDIQLQPIPCEIKQLVTDLITLFQPEGSSPPGRLDIRLAQNLPTLLIDELYVRQILIDLIVQAFKLTTQGIIQLTFAWHAQRLEFSITGALVNPTSNTEVFSSVNTTVSRQLIQRMGGQLQIDSLNAGQAFLFQGTIAAPAAHSESYDDTCQVDILIADNNNEISKLIKIYLEEAGYQVMCMRNGDEAIEMTLQIQPQLLLLDIQSIQNYEMITQIRAQGFKQAIIALSNSHLTQDQAYAYQMGCDAYLTKPIYIENLLITIAQLLGSDN